MGSEVDQSKEWAKRHLQLRSKGSRHAAACVTASAELPLSPREAYELMSHPDNAVIFRGIERCTYRQVLWAAADAGRPSDGRQTVEVENESGGPLPACVFGARTCLCSLVLHRPWRCIQAAGLPVVCVSDGGPAAHKPLKLAAHTPCSATAPSLAPADWHFLFFRGSIQTRMLVHEDPGAGTIHVRLAPAGGTAPLQLMTGKWRFAAGAQPACPPACLPVIWHIAMPCCAFLTQSAAADDDDDASWELQLLPSRLPGMEPPSPHLPQLVLAHRALQVPPRAAARSAWSRRCTRAACPPSSTMASAP